MATTAKAAKTPQRATVRSAGGKAKAVKQSAGKQGPSTRQAKKPDPITRRTAAAAPPKVSKDALRAQVAKLERTNASLRTRNKELKQTVEAAAERIAQLESELSRHEKRAANEAAPARAGKMPGRRVAETREQSDGNPDDAPPPGVAVQLDEEDRKVVEHQTDEVSPE
jgi:hypothetical protein